VASRPKVTSRIRKACLGNVRHCLGAPLVGKNFELPDVLLILVPRLPSIQLPGRRSGGRAQTVAFRHGLRKRHMFLDGV